jgi:dTDP-4-dehydrorhamnose reductase
MSEKIEVLVTGSNGLLGQSIVRRFHKDYKISGCDLAHEDYNKVYPLHKYHRLDLAERDAVQRFFYDYKPKIVINTAGYTKVDQSEEERDLCWAVNVRGVEFLVEAVNDCAPIFIQISTDYVFDGKNGLYRETDETSPVSYYGHTKLAAEKIIRSSGFEYIIPRTVVLFGSGTNVRQNFVTWVIDELSNQRKIQVVNDQRGNPTLVDDLSEALYRLLKIEEYGIFHIAGNEVCSRLEFAHKIADKFDLDRSLISEISSSELNQKAPRPSNSSLILDKLANTLDWLPGGLDESLTRLKSQIEKL